MLQCKPWGHVSQDPPKPSPDMPAEFPATAASPPGRASQETAEFTPGSQSPSTPAGSPGAAPRLQPGDSVAGRFTIVRFIAAGGMGEVYRIAVDLWATSNVFLPGHRLRLEVSSSNFPRFDRNLNTGGDQAKGTQMLKATNAVYHDKSNCPDGERIKPENKRYGTDNRRYCEECPKVS